MQHFDYAVIGGGIVGLSVAWTLLEKNRTLKVAVIEKEASWAAHQTGRNSGVIHSGIYYAPGSLKAKLCRDGSTRLVEFCTTHAIPFERCGKVIVATSDLERVRLRALYQRGLDHGLDVRWADAEEVKHREPHVSCVAGVIVGSTGIVDYTAVCRKIAQLVECCGGTLMLGTKVTGFVPVLDGTILVTSSAPITASHYVNCAGLQSDRIARAGGEIVHTRIVPFRGEYYELIPERRHLVTSLVYPVPDPTLPFLGVHFTRMIDGSVHAGPNAVLSLKREGYRRAAFSFKDSLDTLTFPGFWKLARRHCRSGAEEFRRSFSKPAFVRSLQRLIPEIQARDLIPSRPGVRAQALRPDGSLVDDFLINEGRHCTHVCNAPSPAATACLEIAREVVQRAERAPDTLVKI